MNAQRLLQTVSAILYKNLPPGISRSDLRGFLQRHQASLLVAIQQQYDRICRLNVLLPGVEHRIGYAELPPGSADQVAVFVRDVGSSPRVLLAVKARCHPQDPYVLRQFAVHSRREDERTWRLHPGSSWEGNESEAIRAFLKAHLHQLRWWEGEVGSDDEGSWEGAEHGPYVLEDPWAQQTAASLLKEDDEDDELRSRRDLEKQQADYEDTKRKAAEKATHPAARPPSSTAAPPAKPKEEPAGDPTIRTEADIVAELERRGLKHEGVQVATSRWGAFTGRVYQHSDRREVQLHTLQKPSLHWVVGVPPVSMLNKVRSFI